MKNCVFIRYSNWDLDCKFEEDINKKDWRVNEFNTIMPSFFYLYIKNKTQQQVNDIIIKILPNL